MIWKEAKKILTVMLSFILFSGPCQILCVYGYQVAGSSATGQANGGTEGAPMSTEELQSLVAPIALYPDSLVAQILTRRPSRTKSPLLTTGSGKTRV